MSNAARYSLSMRVMHHLIAILIIGLLIIGLYMTGLDRKDPSRMDLYNLHKTFGWFVLWLVIIRLTLR